MIKNIWFNESKIIIIYESWTLAMMNILIILIYEIHNVISLWWINFKFPYISYLVNWYTVTVIFSHLKKWTLLIFKILIYKSLLPSAGFTVSLHFGIKKSNCFTKRKLRQVLDIDNWKISMWGKQFTKSHIIFISKR